MKGTAPPYICPYSVLSKMGVNDLAYKVMMAGSLGHSFKIFIISPREHFFSCRTIPRAQDKLG